MLEKEAAIVTQNWQVLDRQDQVSQAELLREALNEAEAILVGVGAGMGAADGFTYVGPRFQEAFPDFISKYGWLDMFQASVFPFANEAESWAFFSRFVKLNYLDQGLGASYVRMRQALEGRNYHIITSNADNAFEKADYDPDKVFDVQGKYILMQCMYGCHPKRYRIDDLVEEMVDRQEDMRVPADLIPQCPACGQRMELNRRNHWDWMVEDEAFKEEQARYEHFLDQNKDKKILLLEMGCGYMAPQVIKHPFQDMAEAFPQALYLTVNLKDYRIPPAIRSNTIWLEADIRQLLEDLENLDERSDR
ncbi:deacetylase SIR2 [Aerococcus sp. HMSC072A12]|uniref:Deacetylase SIR2 n=1 Tax=Aerococcus sanguinicola TaxID=119206 RepID=A0A5N1GIF0_9LACT|nr:deacetylase SIR2 [Aerococcus sanguinicola]OFK13835.1 deacetylase SIR2 [Aerococcus sp. HMSC072A12]OFR33980.1 deacetylase SIR2 [Aerococcus sp. HMSC061A03]OFT42320.1 deacetylase SIR2 [Aerococcus sp. HMSC06H08]